MENYRLHRDSNTTYHPPTVQRYSFMPIQYLINFQSSRLFDCVPVYNDRISHAQWRHVTLLVCTMAHMCSSSRVPWLTCTAARVYCGSHAQWRHVPRLTCTAARVYHGSHAQWRHVPLLVCTMAHMYRSSRVPWLTCTAAHSSR